MMHVDKCRPLHFTQQIKTIPQHTKNALLVKQYREAWVVKFGFELGVDLADSLGCFWYRSTKP